MNRSYSALLVATGNFLAPIGGGWSLIPLMRARSYLLIAGFLLAALGGYWIARSAVPDERKKAVTKEVVRKVRPGQIIEPDPLFRRGPRAAFQSDREAMEAGALVGQRSLIFKDREALENFLARAGGKLRIMGRIDGLNVLRIGFMNYQDLADLLDGSEELGMIFPAIFPEAETVAAQPGAVPMGNNLLEWLGIIGDNSQWGAGVKIAVLDTGVSVHSAFGGAVIALGAAGDVNGHGTAVSSMILGKTEMMPGVAPGATVLSIQIADSEGRSDSFKIAEGIMAAIEAGASVINISMGSSSDSAVLRAAIAKAVEAGVMIVAPTGNSGLQQVFYPAANKGVIAVGAVDRSGAQLAFSNAGESVALAAPGYQLNAAWVGDTAASVSGTSFSSPIVAGLIAATMTQRKLSAKDAWALVSATLNESGQPGKDTALGGGLPDMSRILLSGTRGVYDAAVASQWVGTKDGTQQLEITVQNRGTENLINASLNVNSPSGTRYFTAPSLAVGAIQTFTLPLASRTREGEFMRFESNVTLSNGQLDIKASNNRRVENYTAPTKR